MTENEKIIEQFRVPHGKSIPTQGLRPRVGRRPQASHDRAQAICRDAAQQDVSAMAEAQDRLYAADTWSILIVFQAMDAAGKDSTIKHVMSGVNPQGCQVYQLQAPVGPGTPTTTSSGDTPGASRAGRIGIFNRSYYEEVLVVRVDPALVHAERIPDGKLDDDFWADRYADINAFERHLTRNGTTILKFFLHLSKNEQRKRFLKRLEDPGGTGSSRPATWLNGRWDDYMNAYEAGDQRHEQQMGPLVHHPRRPQVGRPRSLPGS